MSSRQLRRLRLDNQKDTDEAKSDEDSEFTPGYSKVQTPHENPFRMLNRNKMKGKQPMAVSDEENQDSDDSLKESTCAASDEEPPNADDSEKEVKEPQANAKLKKGLKKKSKKKANRSPSRSSSFFDVDEIAQAVASVSLLTEASQPEPEASVSNKMHCIDVLTVDSNNLDPKVEYRRMVGPLDSDEPKHIRRKDAFMLKNKLQVFAPHASVVFRGMEMVKLEEVGGKKYFKFRYRLRYENELFSLMALFRQLRWAPAISSYPIDTLEGLMQTVDFYLTEKQHMAAMRLLEGGIIFLQKVTVPGFSLIDGRTILAYDHVENRGFHVALLKYVYLLSMKACHTTALEICKVLLNLDPSDPLAVITVIDVVALRAHKFKWLLELYNKWVDSRHGKWLYNMVYSRALAQYYLSTESGRYEDLEVATDYLRHAILSFPNMAYMILDLCSKAPKDMLSHPIFKLTKDTTARPLQDLQSLYCRLVSQKWRLPEGGLQWLHTNLKQIAHDYQSDGRFNITVQCSARERKRLFVDHPLEVRRHMAVITSMSNYIAEGAMPSVGHTLSCNPFPHHGTSLDPWAYYRREFNAHEQYISDILDSNVPLPDDFAIAGPLPDRRDE